MFVATLGHSRRLHVRAFRAEKQEHWFAGLESAFTTFGGVRDDVLMDNPRALVVHHDAVSRSVQSRSRSIGASVPSPARRIEHARRARRRAVSAT
jgi:transposase